MTHTIKLGRNTIPRYVATCYAKNVDLSEEEKKAFSNYIDAIGWSVSLDFPDFAHCGAPGYLFRQVGSSKYLVPYNLVPTFPTEAQIQWLTPLILAARVQANSRFCFSGSSTFIGKVEAIGDLDFCEYAVGGNDLLAAVAKKLNVADLELKKIRLGAFHASAPFDLKDFPQGTLQYNDLNPFKLDFICRDQFYGALAVTNVVIVLNENPDDNALTRSFAFQEVVVLAVDSMHLQRDLDDSLEFGRYVAWLRDQVGIYVTKAGENDLSLHLALKALKRALSWFLIVGLEGEVSSVIEGLSENSLRGLMALYRSAEVQNLENPTVEHEPIIYSDEQKRFLMRQLDLARNLQATMNEYMHVRLLEKTS